MNEINGKGEVIIIDKNEDWINPATEETLSNILSKLPTPFSFDSNGNLQINVNSNSVGLATDATLQSVLSRDLKQVNGVALTGRDWSQDFAYLGQIKADLDNLNTSMQTAAQDPIDELVLNAQTVNAAGTSNTYPISNVSRVELLIVAEGINGSPSLQFHIDVLEPTTNKVIKSYDGTALTAEGVDNIFISNSLLGDTIQVRYDGTLDSSNYFSSVTARLIVRR